LVEYRLDAPIPNHEPSPNFLKFLWVLKISHMDKQLQTEKYSQREEQQLHNEQSIYEIFFSASNHSSCCCVNGKMGEHPQRKQLKRCPAMAPRVPPDKHSNNPLPMISTISTMSAVTA
jgi:hypothetical protein